MAESQSYHFKHPTSGYTITFENRAEQPSIEEVREAYEKTFTGDITFDNLTKDYSWSSIYVNDLQHHYDDFESTPEDLVEKEFEYWNAVEYNLTIGANEAIKLMRDMPLAERQRIWRRFDAYDRTKARGEGSRGFIEQLKGVGGAMATDITNLAAGGIVKNVLQKTAGKGALRWMLRNILFPGATGATWASLSNAERQIIEMNLDPTQEFDPRELAISGGFGFAGGTLVKPIVATAGQTLKFVANPKKVGLSAAESILDIMGGSGAAQKGVVSEASTAFGFTNKKFPKIRKALDDVINSNKDKTESGAEAARIANNTLRTELTIADGKFRARYKEIGELDVTAKEVMALYKAITKAIPKGKLPNIDFIITRMKTTGKNVAIKGDEMTPTQTLRALRRVLGNSAYDKNLGAMSEVLKFHHKKSQDLFNLYAKKSGQGDAVKLLDSEYSEFQQLQRAILNAADEESAAQNLIQQILTNPQKSSILLDKYLKDVELIGKRSGNKDLLPAHKELLQNTLNENLFEKGGFLKYFQTASGRETLQKLYPNATNKRMERWGGILEKAHGRGTAATFWGRMITQAIGAGGGFVVGGGVGALAGMTALNTLLQSPQFTNLVMKVYTKTGVDDKVLGRIQTILIKNGASEEQAALVAKGIRGGIEFVARKETTSNIPEETIESFDPAMKRLLQT